MVNNSPRQGSKQRCAVQRIVPENGPTTSFLRRADQKEGSPEGHNHSQAVESSILQHYIGAAGGLSTRPPAARRCVDIMGFYATDRGFAFWVWPLITPPPSPRSSSPPGKAFSARSRP